MATAATGPLPFRTAAVLGAGVMGAQIAAHLANAGLSVHLLDIAGPDDDRDAVVKQGFATALKLTPDPFFSEAVTRRIALGNFDDHLDRIAEADWVIEAVVEKLEIKQRLMERVEGAASPDAVISTNTSGIPIRLIAANRSPSFKARFLGTHFFNPPRYLQLLELIPHADTDPAVVERAAWFGRVHLGKGVVVARDTPGFIGNRIGIFAMLHGIRAMTDGGYTIEEVDALTGPLIGRPSSATFRTADVVGLDTLADVATYLFGAVADDESRDSFRIPQLLRKLVDTGATGAKAGGGFYRKEGKVILSVDPESMGYEPPKSQHLDGVDDIRKLRDLPSRVSALYAHEGRAGSFFRQHVLAICAYCARRIPEIAASPAAVDRAMRSGFVWEMGPFEIWDAVGFARVLADMRAASLPLPEWIDAMVRSGATSFYRESGVDSEVAVYDPVEGYVVQALPADEISLSALKRDERHTLWQNAEAALLDLGDGVALFEFRSKANSLGREIVGGLIEVIEMIEAGDFQGLIIGNEGKNFSVGANLGEIASLARQGRFDAVDQIVRDFQHMTMRVRYAARPVVVATHSQALGGGCELALACPNPVAAAESYLGLVEMAVGLIPAAGGTMGMAARAHERAASERPDHIQPCLASAFETVAMATVSSSSHHARELGYLPAHALIVMNTDRRLHVAKEEVLRLSRQGYAPPPARLAIKVLGRPGAAQLEMTTSNLLQSRCITEYEHHLGGRLAYVMCGGDLSAPALVGEDYLLDLEREVFLSLLGQEKTQERIASILESNRPLRN
ncbi:MAG: 3-hydroxyacyl-CoA dehydrogenase [Gemmatimonadetes bacterium]|nr:3-hydroxyacyl-CoA dehydrogenase [Gemmatimonadota bacterium]